MRPQTSAYLDCNATTPTLPIAADAAMEAMKTLFGNPSSSHLVGLQAKHILEKTRKTAAKAVGASPDTVIFTSGATEAIQTAIFSVLSTAKQAGLTSRKSVLYGATEHKAVPQALHHWVSALGLPIDVVELAVDERGQINVEQLRKELPRALLVCTMAVNNETGVIQDLSRIEKVLLETGSDARWLVDCVQALGKRPLGLANSRIDYAPFSGHKLYAPKGIGFLIVRTGAPLVPLIVGGGQERGLRSGTENLPGVAALGAVLEALQNAGESSPFASEAKQKTFRDRLVAELKNAFPQVEFNTPFEVALPTTINFSVPGLSSKELLDLFDSAGIRLSAGSACSSASTMPSHVLDAMGVPEWRSVSALRLSFGPCTSEDEIERGCRAIREAAMALRSTCLLNTVGGFEAPEHLRDGVLQLRVGATNTWIIADRESRRCVVIDPCQTVAERIEGYVRCQNLQVIAILDTHSHADHVSVRPVLESVLKDHMADSGAVDDLGWPVSGTHVIEIGNGAKAHALAIGRSARGETVLARVHTSGHTIDSHAMLLGTLTGTKLTASNVAFAFCGDTILSGGLGRTNFTVSDTPALYHSLRQLKQILGPRTILCPAHDYDNSFATTLEVETRENKLLDLDLGLEQFVLRKDQIDKQLESIEREFRGIVCGVAGASTCRQDADLVISAEEACQRLAADPKAFLMIDVREPQEHALFHEWSSLGLTEDPRNVPLSRFVNFMQETLQSAEKPRPLLLVCRSGNRSLQAAKSLRRMGYTQAYSLDGGVALLS